MSIIALGVNHRTAPIELRERLVFQSETMDFALHQLKSYPGVNEGAILSTCNRTELYCHTKSANDEDICYWLSDYHQIAYDTLKPYIYSHPDSAAVRHLLRVASGLDSMILGEPQILGQVKQAYRCADKAGALGSMLNRLFQHTFSVAKQVRTDTAISASPVSVAFAAVDLGKQIFGALQNKTALVIGAGETIELVTRHLYENNIGRIIVANRTLQKAHNLATQFDGYAIALGEIGRHLADVDIVISSTASQLPILGKGCVESALKQRKHKPMLMVDIAVPRDIEPEIGDLEDVYLYTVDDLDDIIQENLENRQEAAKQAEEIIDNQVMQFMNWMSTLKSVDTITQLREKIQGTQKDLLNQAIGLIKSGKDPEYILKCYAHKFSNKILHEPCTQLRKATIEGREEMISVTQELFNLKEK